MCSGKCVCKECGKKIKTESIPEPIKAYAVVNKNGRIEQEINGGNGLCYLDICPSFIEAERMVRLYNKKYEGKGVTPFRIIPVFIGTNKREIFKDIAQDMEKSKAYFNEKMRSLIRNIQIEYGEY